jgi:uncharacterized membrane protein YraQ (UPF0718 family)
MSVVSMAVLEVLQWGGVSIYAVSYVILAMSIGLLVDFLKHVWNVSLHTRSILPARRPVYRVRKLWNAWTKVQEIPLW